MLATPARTDEALHQGGGVKALSGKGVNRGMQLFCPKKQKERKTWWAGPTLYFSEIGGLQVLTPDQS